MSTKHAPLPTAPILDGSPPRILIVRAPYYRDVVDGLSAGAQRILGDVKADVAVIDVGGAFELPQAIRIALRGRDKFDGYVALGCVLEGETDHYRFLCEATMAGFMSVSLQFGLCLGTGLLTVRTLEQAVDRSRLDGHNKGAEAAAACLLQIAAARRLGAV